MTNQQKRQRCEVWLRSIGYYRPLANFNIGKRAEAYSRKFFSVIKSVNSNFKKDYGKDENGVAKKS